MIMATLLAQLLTIINTKYGDLGGGGSKPEIVNEEDDAEKRTPFRPSGADYIVGVLEFPTFRDPLTYDFANIINRVMIGISSPTSADRLLEIKAEVRRVVNTERVADIDVQFSEQEFDEPDRQSGIFYTNLTVVMEQDAADSTVA